MVDEKDRLGGKLREKEKGEEDRYFAERDKALLEKMRAGQAPQGEAPARGRCPRDGEALAHVDHLGVSVDECPRCRGMWLDQGELQTIARRENDSWIGRYFLRGKA